MAFTTQIRQALSELHDAALAAPETVVTREVTIGANTYRIKVIVYSDGNFSIRTRRI